MQQKNTSSKTTMKLCVYLEAHEVEENELLAVFSTIGSTWTFNLVNQWIVLRSYLLDYCVNTAQS